MFNRNPAVRCCQNGQRVLGGRHRAGDKGDFEVGHIGAILFLMQQNDAVINATPRVVTTYNAKRKPPIGNSIVARAAVPVSFWTFLLPCAWGKHKASQTCL
jgi:hypothetical protein